MGLLIPGALFMTIYYTTDIKKNDDTCGIIFNCFLTFSLTSIFSEDRHKMNTENTRYGALKISELLADAKRIFFVGIGGINMSSLAAISRARGYEVSGSDRSVSANTERLEKDGIHVHIGHSAENVCDTDALIYTVSVPLDNPEYVEAGKRGIPRISRADYLGWLMKKSPVRLGVSGMHGKSTATGMCASILLAAACDPTISSGAVIPELGCTYRAGHGDVFLYESCEYKDSFLSFYPTIQIILNIDMDHPDYFTGLSMVKDSFKKCLSLVGDAAVVNWSDANVREVCEGYGGRLIRYGTAMDGDLRPREEYDWFAEDIELHPHGSDFTLVGNGIESVHIHLSEAGLHNIDDAVAAAAATVHAGISISDVCRGLESFHGAARRMELTGHTHSGAEIYLDYAHHPTEIKAALTAAKGFGGKLVTVFQPHTYTRTKALFSEFTEALAISDEVIVADIFAAREADIYGVDSKMLADAINGCGGDALYSGDIGGDGGEFDRIADYAAKRVTEGDDLIIMGAGSVDKIASIITEKR